MDAKAPEDATSSETDKKTLTDKEIVGLCVDFLLAGFETTKNTMSYVSYLLSLNTEKQDLLCNAIDKYYEDNEVSESFYLPSILSSLSLSLRMLHYMMLLKKYNIWNG